MRSTPYFSCFALLVFVAGELKAQSTDLVLGGVGDEYNFTKHLVYYLYAGHTIMNDIRLHDENKDDVYVINKVNTFYGRSGLKFKI